VAGLTLEDDAEDDDVDVGDDTALEDDAEEDAEEDVVVESTMEGLMGDSEEVSCSLMGRNRGWRGRWWGLPFFRLLPRRDVVPVVTVGGGVGVNGCGVRSLTSSSSARTS